MDYMTRLLVGAAHIVAADKAAAAEAKRAELGKQEPESALAGADLLVEMAEYRGRHEAWLEAAQLLDRVCRQADDVVAF